MIAIRELQHYCYCPHRWGVLHLEDGWQDNVFTVLADILHQKVHSGKKDKVGNKQIVRNLSVFSDSLQIYGKVDCVELVYGVESQLKCINLIEYKPTQPKSKDISESDKMQLYAQYRCLSELFNCQVNAYMYYENIKHRQAVEFCEQDESLLLNTIRSINNCYQQSIVPQAEYSAKCQGCSMSDTCMPKVNSIDVKNIIMRELK